MIGSGDDADRTAKNPNRVTQDFNMIGKGEDVSDDNDDLEFLPIMTKDEREAKERYYWSKIRQAMKLGQPGTADYWLEDVKCNENEEIFINLTDRLAVTFNAGCYTLGDPTPIKEKDHD